MFLGQQVIVVPFLTGWLTRLLDLARSTFSYFECAGACRGFPGGSWVFATTSFCQRRVAERLCAHGRHICWCGSYFGAENWLSAFYRAGFDSLVKKLALKCWRENCRERHQLQRRSDAETLTGTAFLDPTLPHARADFEDIVSSCCATWRNYSSSNPTYSH